MYSQQLMHFANGEMSKFAYGIGQLLLTPKLGPLTHTLSMVSGSHNCPCCLSI